METSWTLPVPKHKFSDLYLCFCGYEACQPFHSYGPAVRPNYVIHYIISGKGTFTIGNRTYRLTAGQGFFLMPNVRTYYEADADDPWTYLWIGFDGEKAASYVQELGLSEEHPVYQCSFSGELQSLLFQMQKNNTYDTSDQYLLEGCLYQFFSILSREITLADPSARESGNLYVEKAVEFIRNNYSNEILVSDIARYVCINRSYLYTLFQKYLHTSPQDYLSSCRITRALELLSYTDLSIETVAFSCGYRNAEVFTKAFRQKQGMTPSAYRKKFRLDTTPDSAHVP